MMQIDCRGYITAAAFMVLVATFAAYTPARRAANISVLVALRDDWVSRN